MKGKINQLIFSLVMCTSLFACSKGSNQQEPAKEKEPAFQKMVPTNLEEDVDFIRHDNDDRKWKYDTTMWYVNNLDKVPLPDPQVYEENGTYYIVGTDDSSSCKYIPCGP